MEIAQEKLLSAFKTLGHILMVPVNSEFGGNALITGISGLTATGLLANGQILVGALTVGATVMYGLYTLRAAMFEVVYDRARMSPRPPAAMMQPVSQMVHPTSRVNPEPNA